MNITSTSDYALDLHENVPQNILKYCADHAYKHQAQILSTEFTGNSFIDDNMYLPEHLINECNVWLESIGLPNLHYAVIFQKRCYQEIKNPTIHIDYNADYNDVAKCALNIPIANCENTTMSWWTGNYDTELSYSNSTCCQSNTPSDDIIIPNVVVTWNEEPNLITTYNIPQLPHICRIDIPHSVTAKQDFRIMLSIRFDGNPTYEEIMHKYLSYKKELC